MTTNITEPSTPPRAPDVESWRGTKPATSVQEDIALAIEAAREQFMRVTGATRQDIACKAYNDAARIARDFRAPVTEPVAVDEECEIDWCAKPAGHKGGHSVLVRRAKPSTFTSTGNATVPPVSDDTTTDETVALQFAKTHRPNYVTEGVGEFVRTRVKCDGGDCDFYVEHRNWYTALDKHSEHMAEALLAIPSPVGGVSDNAGPVKALALLDLFINEGVASKSELENLRAVLAAHGGDA